MRKDAKITFVYDSSKLTHSETYGLVILPQAISQWALQNLGENGFRF